MIGNMILMDVSVTEAKYINFIAVQNAQW